jgi:SAM-dependent methyltransferase
MLTALTGGDARAWATAPLHGCVLLPRVDDGRLAPALTGRDTADGIGLLLVLHRIVDLDRAFADLRHVLRPGGTLVVVVPSVSVRSLADLRWRSVLRPVRRGPWRHRAALDDASWLLTAADFAVLGDDRVPFALPLPDADAARRAVDDLPAAGLWPELSAEARAGMAAGLEARAGPGCLLPVPLRRLVARR